MSDRRDVLAARKALLVARSRLYRVRMQVETGQLQRSILAPWAVLGGVMRLFTVVKAFGAVAAWVLAARRE